MSVNPKGFGPDIYSKSQSAEDILIESINFSEIKGVMALLFVGLVSASVVIIIEIIMFVVCNGSIWMFE